MVRRVVGVLAGVAVLLGCAAPADGPIERRPYLVAVDPIDPIPTGSVAGTLVVERDCVLLEDDDGLLLPLFGAPTRFGPLDGGAVTIDVHQTRVRVGDEVRFAGGTGEVTEGLRSRYPGIDLTRCGVRRYALVGEVTS